MIQRIQTVYLILGIVALAALLFIDRLWADPALDAYGWFGPAVLALGGLVMLAAIAGIFTYKNRTQQKKIVLAAQYLTLLLALVLYGGLYLANALTVRTAEGIDVAMLIVLLLPIAGYVLFLMARRAIQKDIEKVKSMDRLR